MGRIKQLGIERANYLAELGVPRRLADKIGPTHENTGRVVFKNLTSDVPEILLYEQIGLDWYSGEGVTAKAFAEQLNAIKASTIRVRINSPGGDVFDGITIYNLLAGHKSRIEVVVDGLAASAASVVAMAGDHVAIQSSAQMMIHSAWTIAAGNSGDFRDVAEVLEKVDGQLADVYSHKSGKPASHFRRIMPKDNYLTASEAKDMGLVDEVLSPPSNTAASASSRGPRTERLTASHRKRMLALKRARLSL